MYLAKGLIVKLTVDSGYMSQDADINTYQNGYQVDSGRMYIDEGSWTYEIVYENDMVQEGPFEVCVSLVGDSAENCGEGYNGEEMQPEDISFHCIQ
jgi:hypothetical protein